MTPPCIASGLRLSNGYRWRRAHKIIDAAEELDARQRPRRQARVCVQSCMTTTSSTVQNRREQPPRITVLMPALCPTQSSNAESTRVPHAGIAGLEAVNAGSHGLLLNGLQGPLVSCASPRVAAPPPRAAVPGQVLPTLWGV